MARGSRYQHVRELARGGMGRVDLVVDRAAPGGRLLAMKRLLPELLADPKAREMFLQEGNAAAGLDHANVVAVLGVGEDEQGPYLLMEPIRGVSLAALIERSSALGELIPVEVVVSIARQVAEGLTAVHDAGLVHRDVSPSNVLLGFDGVARLTDFGIAKATDATAHTTTNVLKGKLGYLAPEQLRFERSDARTDLHALGVCLHEALLGERLFRGEPAEVASAIANEPPADVGERRRDAPLELSELLFDLLAKDRDARPASAREVADRLAAMADPAPDALAEHLRDLHAAERAAQARWGEDAERILAAGPRRARPWGWALAAAVLLGAVGGWWVLSDDPTPNEVPLEAPPLVEPTPAPAVPPEPLAPPAAEPRTDEVRTPSRRREPRRRRGMTEGSAPSVPMVDTWGWDEQ